MIQTETQLQSRIFLREQFQTIYHSPHLPINEGPIREIQNIEQQKKRIPIESFGQLMFVKEHQLSGGRTIKKVAAISLPNPFSWETTEEVLLHTLSINAESVERWNGVQKGKIVAMGKPVDNIFGLFHLMDRFVELSGVASAASKKGYAYRQEIEEIQKLRKDFLLQVKMDAVELLNTPYLTQWSAWNEKYKGMGICLIEGYIDENGYWIARNAKGEEDRVINVATDEPHRKWLVWAEGQLGGYKGDLVIADGEDTETVKSCRGSKGCMEYFEEMQRDGKSVIFERPTIQTTIVLPTIFSSLPAEEKKVMCKGCKHEQSECQCV